MFFLFNGSSKSQELDKYPRRFECRPLVRDCILRHNHFMSSVFKRNTTKSETEVLVIGAGIAGLYAAYRLLQANIPFKVLESDDHAGGRIKSRKEKNSQLGLVLDEGANLINSTDTLATKLMNRFGINYVRRLKSGMDSMHYLVAGNELDQQRFDQILFSESRVAINHIVADQEIWREDKMRDLSPKFIDESIAAYLRRIEAGPVLRAMLKSFFWSEYGYEIDDLNLHVLFINGGDKVYH